MKKSLSLISLFVCLALLFSGCGYKDENVEAKTTKLDKEETKILTIAENLSGDDLAIEDDCFYAYDTDFNLYRVLCKDTEQIAENEAVAVTYKKITEYTYKEDTVGNWTPKYQIKAVAVEDSTIELTVHKSESKYSSVCEDCFYAYDDEGEDYRVLWEDTTGLTNNDRVLVRFKSMGFIVYDMEPPYEGAEYGPDWCSPTKEIRAVKVEKVP